MRRFARLPRDGVAIPAAADRIPGRQYADLLHRLADLPPLSSRRIALAFPDALPPVPGIDLRLWGSVAYCLAAFLCRSTADVPLQLTLTGTAGQLTLLLAAPPPCPVPPGSCTIDRLADRFFNAPELTVAAALAGPQRGRGYRIRRGRRPSPFCLCCLSL